MLSNDRERHPIVFFGGGGGSADDVNVSGGSSNHSVTYGSALMEGGEELNDISYLQPALHLPPMMAKRRGGLMKGMVGYADKAAAPTLQAQILL